MPGYYLLLRASWSMTGATNRLRRIALNLLTRLAILGATLHVTLFSSPSLLIAHETKPNIVYLLIDNRG